MAENSSTAVLVSASDVPSSTPAPGSTFQPQPERVEGQAIPGTIQPKQVDESLIQVIEKLTKIVEKRPQKHCIVGGQNRGHRSDSSARRRGTEASSPRKKMKGNCEEVRADGSSAEMIPSALGMDDSNNNSIGSEADHKRTVTCYQCSLCPYLSHTSAGLREHSTQHDEQHSDLILMCSACRFTSRDQGQLEAHIKSHFEGGGDTKRTRAPPSSEEKTLSKGADGEQHSGEIKGSLDDSSELPKKKKWYSNEEYGLYRCLICSYVCSQQRMSKTHAWKHAGLVDCSYPIFEEEESGSARQETQAATNSIVNREDLVISSPGLPDQKLPEAIKSQSCVPVATKNQQDPFNLPVAHPGEGSATAGGKEEEGGYIPKDVSSEEPVMEVQVSTEADGDTEVDGTRESSSVTDSSLSSAQKIINSSPNSAGHINVIVERLPSAEDSVMVAKPSLLSPDMDGDKSFSDVKEAEQNHVGGVGGGADSPPNSPPLDADCKSPLANSDASPRDENVPPTSRKRTHSESLRLHSSAAEALVAMPMRTPELASSNLKASSKAVVPQMQNPDMGQRVSDVTPSRQKVSDVEKTATSSDSELHSQADEDEDEESSATKAGISLSSLTVIERLRERSDQNASDEDISKELQDNAQFQNGTVAVAAAGNGAESYVCNIPGMDGLVGSPDAGSVDYSAGSERPYRCRSCHYSSGNKGYIKQHSRVHRQRAPYQCPICEHKASDSKDLENHMIYHCKTRMYQCRHCPDAFHYKSQLRSHERERHSSDMASLTTATEAITSVEEYAEGTDEEGREPKMYKCDVCSYISSTYVGVRNHRRIHNSDKPYRCCNCDFATTNMNSLKSHMRRHPQEQQAVQSSEQYRCSSCGYVCSHPPSSKSHMWKHARDQNYNYEQVNKAINEAISQSSRAAALPPPPTETSQCPAHEEDTTQAHPRAGQLPPGAAMEYCVSSFCCCICGFESTSKERSMEHMKEHEGDIISIISNKEQQGAEAQTAD